MSDSTIRTAVLVIAHAPLASAFVGVACDIGLPVSDVAALDVALDVSRANAVASAKLLAASLRCEDYLILVDLGGCCSPCVIASELQGALGSKARVVTGLNMAMLATALCSAMRSQGLDALAQHVAARGWSTAITS